MKQLNELQALKSVLSFCKGSLILIFSSEYRNPAHSFLGNRRLNVSCNSVLLAVCELFNWLQPWIDPCDGLHWDLRPLQISLERLHRSMTVGCLLGSVVARPEQVLA